MSAMCHWDRLTKCHEKYLVTWASVGAQTFGGGSSPPALPLATGPGLDVY